MGMVENYLIREMYAHTLSIVVIVVTLVTPAHRTRTQNNAGRLCGTLLVLAIICKYNRGVNNSEKVPYTNQEKITKNPKDPQNPQKYP